MTSLREQIIRFVEHLRARGVRISTAETMDAMRGIAAAGFGRAAIREALAATLVKDEGDRPAFDQAFADFFGASEAGELREGTSRDRHDRIEGRGHGGETIVESPSRPEPAKPGANPSQRPEQVHPEQAHDDEAREKPDEAERTEDSQNPRDESDRSTREPGREARGEHTRPKALYWVQFSCPFDSRVQMRRTRDSPLSSCCSHSFLDLVRAFQTAGELLITVVFIRRRGGIRLCPSALKPSLSCSAAIFYGSRGGAAAILVYGSRGASLPSRQPRC